MSEFDGLGAGDLARLLNECQSKFTHNGVTHEVGELDLEQRARLSAWLRDRAKAEVRRSADLTPQEQAEQLTAVMNAAAAGDYSPGGMVYTRAFLTRDGHCRILYEQLRGKIPGLTVTDCEAMYDTAVEQQAKIRRRIAELEDATRAAKPDDVPRLMSELNAVRDEFHLKVEQVWLALQAAEPVDPKASSADQEGSPAGAT